MPPVIRLATDNDAEQIQAIYSPVVSDTAISFELKPPSVPEMRQRIMKTLARLPWLVCEQDGEIRGYAYASLHRTRAAYQWSIDVSVYVHENARRTGVGRAVYGSLCKLLAMQGFYNAYAGITLPNPASVGFHESMGFQPVGVYRAVGYKLGKWHDVGWWQLVLREHLLPPEPTVALGDVRGSAAWDLALARGAPLVRL
ncbi:MAG TPA: N-acetyltransferase [Deltaproteobacteria bacterium]|nr:N-acetyltransferase [Deltaproteobacteria bacterium]